MATQTKTRPTDGTGLDFSGRAGVEVPPRYHDVTTEARVTVDLCDPLTSCGGPWDPEDFRDAMGSPRHARIVNAIADYAVLYARRPGRDLDELEIGDADRAWLHDQWTTWPARESDYRRVLALKAARDVIAATEAHVADLLATVS